MANKKGAGRFGTRPLQAKKRVLDPAAQAHGLGHALDGDQVGRDAGLYVAPLAMSWTALKAPVILRSSRSWTIVFRPSR